MAFSALSGCVTVQRPPAPAPFTAVPSQPSAPRPEGQAETQVVQAPAREALELVEPSRSPGAATPAQPQRTDPEAAPAGQPRPPRSHPRQQHPHHWPVHPLPRRPTLPPVGIPDVEREVRRNTDVCGLGRKYGGWRSGSPEAVICEQTYGRQ